MRSGTHDLDFLENDGLHDGFDRVGTFDFRKSKHDDKINNEHNELIDNIGIPSKAMQKIEGEIDECINGNVD